MATALRAVTIIAIEVIVRQHSIVLHPCSVLCLQCRLHHRTCNLCLTEATVRVIDTDAESLASADTCKVAPRLLHHLLFLLLLQWSDYWGQGTFRGHVFTAVHLFCYTSGSD